MKSVYMVMLATGMAAGCAGTQPAQETAPAGPTPKAYSNLAQVMQGIPFPASNLIFDTQSNDPAAKPAEGTGSGGGATSAFAGVYGGWKAVENAAIALSETANLIMIPGRLCQNGRPVPLDRADFQKFAQGLADAGQAALKAAQSKNLDAMVEVSGTVSDACAACHEVYRDKPDDKDRCM
jgi:cytochrome c556